MRSILTLLMLVKIMLLAACQTTSLSPESNITLTKLLKKRGVVTVPYQRNDNGLFLIPAILDQKPALFLVDTGATKSAIFKDGTGHNPHPEHLGEYANVYGLVETGPRPIISLENFEIGELNLSGLQVAVLPERDSTDYHPTDVLPDGLIGMDVLEDYDVYVDALSKQMSFIPVKYPAPEFTSDWILISLYHNPKAIIDKDLHFFDLRVGNHLLPAVLDTGAEFNIINWEATEIPEIKRLRRRLREEWQIQGAVGKFDPAVRIKVKGLRASRKEWGAHDFIIMNFSHMNTLGFVGQPLVIAGSKLMGDDGFYISFDSNEFWLAPDPIDDKKDELPNTGVVRVSSGP